MRFTKNRISIILLIATLFALPVKAQVKIGENTSPKSFSILELVSKNSGLRLPQLTTEERDNITLIWTAPNADQSIVKAARGLVIYNKTKDCLEFWNSSEWISLCVESSTPPPNSQ